MNGKIGGMNDELGNASSPEEDAPSAGGYDNLVKIVLYDSKLNVQEKKQLIDELRKGNIHDRWTYRNAILILGLIGLFSIIVLCLLSAYEKNIPEGIIAMGSAAIGGLSALLSTGRSKP